MFNKMTMKKEYKFKVIKKGSNLRFNVCVNVELENKNGDENKPLFSVSGSIGNGSRWVACGQCLDTVLSDYNFVKEKDGILFKDIHSLWKKYHLNNMNAGTVKQENALKSHFGENHVDYMERCNYLHSINLYKDNGYEYGTAWLYREIPEDDLNKIKTLLQ